jgi:TonB-linked SusC/RagA family outer membrane protein
LGLQNAIILGKELSLMVSVENKLILMKKQISLLVIFLFIGTVSVIAQARKVTGIVNDSDGNPLPGANVIVKRTDVGTITDLNGYYEISVPETGEVILVFSFVGMDPREEKVGSRSQINVNLTEGAIELDDVVVIAYGSQRKVAVTGAVSTIQTKDLQQSSSANLTNALAGRLSGLTAIQTSGQPGNDNARLYLRGAATLNGQNPLILVDGVPRDDIASIDPNAVGSISILKDASATAVFGVRGANGVILITTRRGEINQKPNLNFSVESSLQSFTRKPESLSSLEYIRLYTEAELNDPNTPVEIVDGEQQKILSYTPSLISKYTNPDKTPMEEFLYPDHNYFGETLYDFSPQTKLNMNMSGGSETTQYFLNVSYLHQGGQFKTADKSEIGYDPGFSLDRVNFRTNVDYQITDNLKAFVNLSSYLGIVNSTNVATASASESAESIVSDILVRMSTMRPVDIGPVTIPGLMWDDIPVDPGYPIIPPSSSDVAPYELINNVGYRSQNRFGFNGSFGFEWNLDPITKGLSTKFMGSYDTRASSTLEASQQLKNYAYFFVGDSVLFTNGTRSANQYMRIGKGSRSDYNINLQYMINYQRVFGEKNKIGAMLLAQRDNWVISGGSDDRLLPYNIIGFAGRFNYSYNDIYLLEFDAGYNGSEQFAPNRRFGFFPSVSVGWVMTNEPFYQRLADGDILNFMKFRFSYGTAGNDQLGNERFLYLSELYYTWNDRSYANSRVWDLAFDPGYMPSLANSHVIKTGKIGNPDIHWELARKQNYGIDIKLFNSLNISFDYFKERRTDILITRNTMPQVLGIIENPKANVGIVENQGFESEIIFNKQFSRNVFITLRGNIGFNDNIVINADEVINPEGYVHRYRQTGYRINQPFGYKIDYSNGNGYFNSPEEVDNYKNEEGEIIDYSFGEYGLGDFKYMDMNGDSIINEQDLVPIGYSSTVPGLNYGITLGITYKFVDFSIMFHGLGRISSYYSGYNVFETGGMGSYLDYHKNAWTIERYENGEDITYPALRTTSPNVNQQPNDFFIMDRSFVRLKNVEIGFTLPKHFISMAGISESRIYLRGQNLFTWDKLKTKTFDPEQNGPLSYPVAKIMSIGASLNF